jgi:hypothetical protein
MIKATIIQDSVYLNRITTFELEYPRFIHAELMTHRQFSRNAASSRAIPIERMHEHIRDNPAMPIHWGRNQPGMQADEQISDIRSARNNWLTASDMAVHSARMLMMDGLHKQIANRVTEPFQTMKTVVTATEYDNFFELRCHRDAQPEIRELALQMQDALANYNPLQLRVGDWHVPYVDRDNSQFEVRYSVDGQPVTLKEAKEISASCCAQVSYRRNDTSAEKASLIYKKLIESKPAHLSPVEHQATPIPDNDTMYLGITHTDRHGQRWSGNFKGWIQLRQVL